MTTSQTQAAWELCRQGLPLIADEATERWSRGQTFELDAELHLARSIQHLISQCNWELRRRVEAR
jgi:hypothetical protein